MRAGNTCVSLFLLLSACGARQVDEGMESVLGTPEWAPCAAEGEVETCADACATSDMQCVANGCAAEPEYCNPDSCDMATQALALDTSVFCTDASVGIFVATTCEEPIHWLFSNTVRCCCAQEE
jgi:hypothetical protein